MPYATVDLGLALEFCCVFVVTEDTVPAAGLAVGSEARPGAAADAEWQMGPYFGIEVVALACAWEACNLLEVACQLPRMVEVVLFPCRQAAAPLFHRGTWLVQSGSGDRGWADLLFHDCEGA